MPCRRPPCRCRMPPSQRRGQRACTHWGVRAAARRRSWGQTSTALRARCGRRCGHGREAPRSCRRGAHSRSRTAWRTYPRPLHRRLGA